MMRPHDEPIVSAVEHDVVGISPRVQLILATGIEDLTP